MLSESNKMMKLDMIQLQKELSLLNQQLMATENEVTDLRIEKQ